MKLNVRNMGPWFELGLREARRPRVVRRDVIFGDKWELVDVVIGVGLVVDIRNGTKISPHVFDIIGP